MAKNYRSGSCHHSCLPCSNSEVRALPLCLLPKHQCRVGMVSTWHWEISSPLLILSGLGQLSQELLFCWQEAHGLAERNVDVARNSCLPYISTSTSFPWHFSEDSCVHLQAHPFSSWTILHLGVPPLYISCPPCPNTFTRVTTMNNHKRPPILGTAWIGGTSHQCLFQPHSSCLENP